MRRRWQVGAGIVGGCLVLATVAVAAPKTLSGSMLTFHDRLRAARDSLVFADLESFQRWVEGLAGTEPPLKAFPEAQREHAEGVRSIARQAAKALTLGEASDQLGRLASQCGRCHSRGEQGPEFPRQPPPSAGKGVKQHMERHLWALDRLWEGLTAGNEHAWAAGAEQLRDPAVTLSELPPTARSKTVETLAQDMQHLGERASRATVLGERARLMGDIVESCGSCHVASGVRGL